MVKYEQYIEGLGKMTWALGNWARQGTNTIYTDRTQQTGELMSIPLIISKGLLSKDSIV